MPPKSTIATTTKATTTTTITTTTLDIANYPVDSLVDIVANLLDSIIETNDRLIRNSSTTAVTHFHSRTIPNIAVYPYLARILKFAPFSNEVLLCLLVYFDRIAKLKKTRYAVNSFTVHRLLITSIVVASKFTSDVFYPNSRYAKVSCAPINMIEAHLTHHSNRSSIGRRHSVMRTESTRAGVFVLMQL